MHHKLMALPMAALAGAALCLAACGSPTTSSHDAGTPPDAGSPPATTVTKISSGNKLPTPWLVTDMAVLKSDNSGAGASAHLNQLVTLSVAGMNSGTSTSGFNTPVGAACALSITTADNPPKTYCDGFALTANGNTVLIDTYNYLGSISQTKPGCEPADNSTVNSITGVWYDFYDNVAKKDTFVISPVTCVDSGLIPADATHPAYAGTGTPDNSKDIQNIASSITATASTVTVKGVVVAAWSSKDGTTFGFTLEDPGGGDHSGLFVYKAKTSTSTATVPAMGDYVTVTGPAQLNGVNIELDL